MLNSGAPYPFDCPILRASPVFFRSRSCLFFFLYCGVDHRFLQSMKWKFHNGAMGATYNAPEVMNGADAEDGDGEESAGDQPRDVRATVARCCDEGSVWNWTHFIHNS
jgi:hypothetical protein